MGHPTFHREGSNEIINAKVFGGTINCYTNIRNINVDLICTFLEYSGGTTYYAEDIVALSLYKIYSCVFLITDNIPLLSLASYAKFLRRTRAATVIQKYWRMYVVRRRYKIRRTATVVLQSYLRGYLARNRYRKVRHYFQLCLFIIFMLIKLQICTKCLRGSCGCRSYMETTNNCNIFLNITISVYIY